MASITIDDMDGEAMAILRMCARERDRTPEEAARILVEDAMLGTSENIRRMHEIWSEEDEEDGAGARRACSAVVGLGREAIRPTPADSPHT